MLPAQGNKQKERVTGMMIVRIYKVENQEYGNGWHDRLLPGSGHASACSHINALASVPSRARLHGQWGIQSLQGLHTADGGAGEVEEADYRRSPKSKED